VSVKLFPTTTTTSLPPTFGHVGLATPHWPGPDLDALPLPHSIVAVTWADQGVGNFVQDRVLNFLDRIVSLYEVDG